MSKRKPSPTEFLDKQFLDLEAENAALRAELRKALKFDDVKVPKIPATYPRKSGAFRKHFVIPDTQVKPGVPTEHMTWAGRYIKEKASEGDVVIHLGDHWDFESLSSYDRGKKCFEGRRVKADIDAGNEALALLDAAIGGAKVERHLLRGNHEDRLTRFLELSPEWEGVVGFDDLQSPGWTVHPFREIVDIDGVAYSHYFYNPRTGRPWGGLASTTIKNVGRSFVQGHRQGLEIALQELPSGGRRRGIICGSFYQHAEVYLGPQGDHWRGMLMLTEVQCGDFDVVELSLDYLRRRYG